MNAQAPALSQNTTSASLWSWATLGALWINLFLTLQPEWEINEQYSYGYLVPFIGAYLLFLRWQCRPEPNFSGSPRALTLSIPIALFIGLTPLQILYSANPDWRLIQWIHAVFILIITLELLFLMGGKAWLKHFAPAFIMFLFAIPWPTFIEQPMVQNLMRLVAATTVEMLNLYGIRAVQEGNLIYLSNMPPVGVEEACSGVRSLQSNIMAAFFFGELFRFRGSLRISLLLLAIPVAILLNLIRTLTLTLAVYNGGAEMLNKWHDTAGNLAAVGGFIGVLILALFLSKVPGGSLNNEPTSTKKRTFTFRPALGVSLVAVILLSHLTTTAWYQLGKENSQSEYRVDIDWEGIPEEVHFEDIDDATRAILRYSEGTHAYWNLPQKGRLTAYFFTWESGKLSGFAGIHRPEVCLPAAGFKAEKKLGTWDWDSGKGLTIPFEIQEFSSYGKPAYVFFAVWNTDAQAMSPEVALSAEARIKQALERQRVGARQQLEFIAQNVSSLEEAKDAVRLLMENAVNVDIITL